MKLSMPEESVASDRPRIFLSYTISKAAHEGTMIAVINAVKESFAENNIDIVDPMTAPVGEFSGISEDISNAIQDSDAMFVIQYPPVLNTALETGFAWALGIPTFHWLPDSRPGQEKEGLQTYLRYLNFADGNITLPTDVISSRYQLFPGDIATNKKSTLIFKERIRACLEALAGGALSDHAIRARRSFRAVSNVTTRLLREHASSVPLCWVLNSLMRQQHDYLDRNGSRKFVVDESIYQMFLLTLNEHKDSAKRVIAVADMNSNIEHFWTNGGIQHIVGARIFRLPWTIFFDEGKLEPFLVFLRVLARQYKVFVTDSDTREAYLWKLRSGISGDYVVFEDVVGRYVDDGFKTTKLVIEYDKELSQTLRSDFEETCKVSVELDQSSKPDLVRRAWISKRGIGRWSETYSGGVRRDTFYYDNYDKHILVWIPGYKDLASKVGGAIIKHLTPQILVGKAIVGEIGIGTGAVTGVVARWCNALNKAELRPLAKYIGVDSASEMCNRTQAAIYEYNEQKRFKITCGSGFQGLRSAVDINVKYDLVCGSLILHYLIEAPSEAESWIQFSKQLDEILAPGGIAIFGGCYFENNIEARQRQLNWWRLEMENNGLEDSTAEQFICGNAEMCNMPSAEIIETYIGGGFTSTFERLGHVLNPFGILTLQRSSEVQ